MRSVHSITTHAGTLVREWRTSRRLSQLDLALEANVSPRHLSCVETGKAQPSRDMIARLADALGMPLRERNALLVAAGFAPRYRETELASPEMAPIRRAIEFILQHQEPYPAIVTKRQRDTHLMNETPRRDFGAPAPGRAGSREHAATDFRSAGHAQRAAQLGRAGDRRAATSAQPGRNGAVR